MRLEGPKRTKWRFWQVAPIELPEALRSHVLETVPSEIGEPQPGRRVAVEGGTRRLRDEDLAPVAGVCDPGGQVHVEADIVATDADGLPGVEPDPDTHGIAVAAALRERPLDGHRRLDRIRRGREHGKERVAARCDLEAAPRLERGAHDRAMPLECGHPCIAEPRREPRALLDVAEEERDGPRRKLTFGDSPGALNHDVSLPQVPASPRTRGRDRADDC